MSLQTLPEGAWECPKCGERKDNSLKRLLDSELEKGAVDACMPCQHCSWNACMNPAHVADCLQSRES